MFDSHDKPFLNWSLPHIATMGRDKILQQTRLNRLLLNIKTRLKFE